jgi:hypothetical protein
VKAVLEAFPGAVIDDVRDLKIAGDDDASDEAPMDSPVDSAADSAAEPIVPEEER